MVVVDDLRTVGRQAHQERAWRQAAETLRVADSVEGLDPENLAMLAEAAFLSGDVTGCLQAYERAFAGHAARGASRAAARSAIGIGRALAMKGAHPLHRAHLLPAAVDVLLAADRPTEAADAAAELAELAARWPTTGLRAAALHAAGAVALTGGSAAAAAAALRRRLGLLDVAAGALRGRAGQTPARAGVCGAG